MKKFASSLLVNNDLACYSNQVWLTRWVPVFNQTEDDGGLSDNSWVTCWWMNTRHRSDGHECCHTQTFTCKQDTTKTSVSSLRLRPHIRPLSNWPVIHTYHKSRCVPKDHSRETWTTFKERCLPMRCQSWCQSRAQLAEDSVIQTSKSRLRLTDHNKALRTNNKISISVALFSSALSASHVARLYGGFTSSTI